MNIRQWGNGVPRSDKTISDNPISIAGIKFERGVGIHAPYTLNIALDGQCGILLP